MQVGEIDLGLSVNRREFNSQINSLASTSRSTVMNAFKGIGKVAGAAFGVAALAKFGKSCIDLGSDLTEVQNVVDTTFTTMSDKVDEFASTAFKQFGMSETVAKKYVGTMGAMTKAFGYSEKAAFDMSTSVAGMAGDVASFYNLSTDEAYTKLKSIWTGETESLKELGVVMTQAVLDQYALANGFGKTTKKMTEQEKLALRYQFVMDKLSLAQGDFAKTSGSWANQVRILTLQFDSFKAAIGQGLINLFTPVINVVNELMGKLVSLANTFKNFTELITGKQQDSISSLSGVTASANENMEGVADSAADTAKNAKKAKKELMGFDRVNKLSKDDSTGKGKTGVSAIGGKTVSEEANKTGGYVSDIKKALDELKNCFKEGFFDGLGDSFVRNVNTIKTATAGIKKTLKDIFTDPTVVTTSQQYVKSIVTMLGNIAGASVSIGSTITSNILGGLDKALNEHSGNIKNYISSYLSNMSSMYKTIGELSVSVADVFSVFGSDSAISITGSIFGTIIEAAGTTMTVLSKVRDDVTKCLVEPFTNNTESIKTAMQVTLDALEPIFESFEKVASYTFQQIKKCYDESLSPIFSTIKDILSTMVKNVTDGYTKHIVPVLDGIKDKFDTLCRSQLKGFVDSFIGVINSLGDAINDIFRAAIKPLMDWASKNVMPILKPIFEFLTGTACDAIGTVLDVLGDCLDGISGMIDFISGVFTADWGKAWDGVKKIFKSFYDRVADLVKGLYKIITDVFMPTQNYFKGIFEATANAIKIIFNGLKDWLKSTWTSIKGIFSNVSTFFSNKFSSALSGIKSAFGGITSWFRGVWNGLKNIVSTTWDGILKLFKTGGTIFKGITDGVSGVFKKIVNGLITGINSVISTPFRAINGMLNKIKNIGVGKLKPFENAWGDNPIAVPKIPMLAQGGYVKANTPQLAMIGDNKHQGEVVAPEDKLLEMAMKAAQLSGNGAGTGAGTNEMIRLLRIIASKNLTIDGKKVTKEVIENVNGITSSTGCCPIFM